LTIDYAKNWKVTSLVSTKSFAAQLAKVAIAAAAATAVCQYSLKRKPLMTVS